MRRRIASVVVAELFVVSRDSRQCQGHWRQLRTDDVLRHSRFNSRKVWSCYSYDEFFFVFNIRGVDSQSRDQDVLPAFSERRGSQRHGNTSTARYPVLTFASRSFKIHFNIVL